jgi:hypothetical protein
MERRTFPGALAGGLLTAPLAADAQQGKQAAPRRAEMVASEQRWTDAISL